MTRHELQVWLRPVQRDFERLLERGERSGVERLAGACADILAHRDALWTFATYDDVEPTNNHAELELRDFVLWRKRSFGAQSERGHRFAERLMTIAHTARKQGRDVLAFLVDCVSRIDDEPMPSLFATA